MTSRNTLYGFVRLMRPANLPTAAADILAGVAVAASFYPLPSWGNIALLVISSVLLYASGVVLNDYFDFRTDSAERPERPIPSGIVRIQTAFRFGMVLMVAGVLCAIWVGRFPGLVAFVLAGLIFLYDALAKHSTLFGPLTMGSCRALNLLLGMSVTGELVTPGLLLVPLVYIASITLVSRGEVTAGNRSSIVFAGVLYSISMGILWTIAPADRRLWLLPALVIFASTILIPLAKAFRKNNTSNIRKAVKAGIISLILLDACIAWAFDQPLLALSILILLPLSIYMSKQFSVT